MKKIGDVKKLKKAEKDGPIEQANKQINNMLDRITDIFVEIDDFCKLYQPQVYKFNTNETVLGG